MTNTTPTFQEVVQEVDQFETIGDIRGLKWCRDQIDLIIQEDLAKRIETGDDREFEVANIFLQSSIAMKERIDSIISNLN